MVVRYEPPGSDGNWCPRKRSGSWPRASPAAGVLWKLNILLISLRLLQSPVRSTNPLIFISVNLTGHVKCEKAQGSGRPSPVCLMSSVPARLCLEQG